MRSGRTQTFLLGLALAALAGVPACSRNSEARLAPDATATLEAIPAADPAQYGAISEMKKWRNPYLIVRPDGVALFDVADSAEILLNPDELLPALAKLPATNWPYGRVVAAAETGAAKSEQDHISIRRNKGIVGGMLAGAHIAVKWVS